MNNGKSISLLVIDDDELMLQLLQKILGDFVVYAFTNAEEALQSDYFDVCEAVIVDVNLPGLTGIEFLEKIRNEQNEIAVILITGINDIDLAVSAVKFGADDMILKPFTPNQLLLSLERVIGNKQLRYENQRLLEELRQKNKRLEELNAISHIRSSKLENDLEMACNLQECLYPKELPVIDGVNIESRSSSVEKISGDFYYFDKLSDKRFALFFADISGHGVTAALFSAMVKAAISSQSLIDSSPSTVIKKMNQFLIKAQIKPSYNYLTLCYLDIDLEKKEVKYANAGLPAPIFIKEDGSLQQLYTNGPFVGIFDVAHYKENSFHFVEGDKLIFFTDGVYENSKDFNVKKGYQSVLNNVNLLKLKPVKTIIEKLYNSMEAKGDKIDDSTYLGIEFLKV